MGSLGKPFIAAAVIMLLMSSLGCLGDDEERRIALDLSVADDAVNVDPGETVNITLQVWNLGNWGTAARVGLEGDDRWEVSWSDNVAVDLDDPRWGTVRVPWDESGFRLTGVNLTLAPPHDAELGWGAAFTVDMMYEDEDQDVEGLQDWFYVAVGWIEPSDAPEDAFCAVGRTASYTLGFEGLVSSDLAEPTPFTMVLDFPWQLECTLTTSAVTDLSPEEIGTTDPVPSVELQEHERADLLLWVHAPPDTPVNVTHEVSLTIWPAEEPVRSYTITLPLRVLPVVHNVTVEPFEPVYSFYQSEHKWIVFVITSKSTVPESLEFTHRKDSSHWMYSASQFSCSLDPGSVFNLSVIVTAPDIPGSTTTFTTVVSYGPRMELTEEASVELEVLDT